MVKAYFDNLEKLIIENINDSKNSIKIAVSWITNKNILEVLNNKLFEDIDVSILTNNDEINNNSTSYDYNLFINNGGKLYFIDEKYFLHHKFMIIDDKTVLSGSYNYTQLSNINIENITYIKEEKHINNFIDEFTKLISYSNKIDKFEKIERKTTISTSFQKLPNEINVDDFKVIEVNYNKNYIKVKALHKHNRVYYMNTRKNYKIGDIIKISKPYEVKIHFDIYKHYYVRRIWKWIKNPIILKE